MNSIKANEGYDEIEAFNSTLVPSEIKSSGIIGIGSEYSFEEWKSFLQSKGVKATDQEFQAFWDDWGADEDMERSQFEESTETTESEKATEIKEEFSENAYLQLINETTPVPMEFHGRYYNSAEEWKEHDPIAFTESYLAWIDGNEKDGVDTGDDGYESKASESVIYGTSTELEPLWEEFTTTPYSPAGAKKAWLEYVKDSGIGLEEAEHWYDEKKLTGYGESKAKEDFGQFTIQDPNLSTDKYPTDEEGFARASWEDAEIEHRKRWLIKAGFPDYAEDDAYLPYFSLPTMVRAVLSQDLHVGGIQAMGESGQVEPDENWDAGRWTSGKGLNEDMYADDDVREFSKQEPKLDTEADIDDYIKNGKEDEDKDEAEERSKADIQAMKDLGAGDFAEDIPDDMSVDQWLGGDDNDDKDEAEEILAGLAINDELEGMKDTFGSSPNADPTTTPLEDHSGTDDSSDTQLDTVDAQQETSDVTEDTVEESFGDCGCKDTKKARTTWESAREGDKQYWLRIMGEDEGYSYYHFEHLPKRVGESLVDKFKIEESEDRGWSKIPALERTNLLRKIGFPPRDAELVANLEYPQLSESLKKDVNDAVIGKKRAEESKREKPDEQLAFENDLYSNMYDGFLKRRGERVDSKKN